MAPQHSTVDSAGGRAGLAAGRGAVPGPPEDLGLFYRKGVLRPGWGILLFLLVLATAIAAQTLLLRLFVTPPSAPDAALTPRDSLPGLVIAIAVTVATAVVNTQERRRFAVYGLRATYPMRHLLGGALAGIALLSAWVLLLHQQDLLVFRGQVLFGAALQWRLALEWAAVYAVAAFAAEFLAHGYLQYTLTRGFGALLRRSSSARRGIAPAFWIAALLLTAVFTLLHRLTGGGTPIELLNTALFSLLMAFSLWRTGSLWWAFGYHAAWSWAASFLWGVRSGGSLTRDHLFLTEATGSALESGGPTGPNGSTYTLGALAAALGIVMLLHRRRTYPDLWDEAASDTATSVAS